MLKPAYLDTMYERCWFSKLSLLILPAGILFLSFKFTDATTGQYLLKGKVFDGSKLLKNDSVYFIHSFPEENSTRVNRLIKTDSEGNYEQNVEWIGACGSGSYEWRKKEELDKEEAILELSKRLNADSLTFIYNKRSVTVKNNWADAIKYWKKDPAHNMQFIIEQDIHF